MTDIFARKPTPIARSKSLAPRFSLWIEMIEAFVTEQRKQFEKVEKHQRIYNAIVPAIEALKMPHDCKITIDISGVQVRLNALPTDFVATYDPLIAAIEDALISIGERKEKTGRNWTRCEYTRRLTCWVTTKSQGIGYVSLYVEIPDGGIADLSVTLKSRTRAENYYHFEDVHKPEPRRFGVIYPDMTA
jgi:ribosome-associated translation inhibitor RaiA